MDKTAHLALTWILIALTPSYVVLFLTRNVSFCWLIILLNLIYSAVILVLFKYAEELDNKIKQRQGRVA